MSNNFKHLKGNTVTNKAMSSELVMNVIDEQYGNLTQRHFKKNGSYMQVTAVLKSFARKICKMAMVNSPAPTFKNDWKNDFSNQTFKILKAQNFNLLIEDTIKEMRKQFPKHVTSSDMIKYSFSKIALHAGCVSRMILHKYHPDFLLATNKEATEAQLRMVKTLRKNAVPTIIVNV